MLQRFFTYHWNNDQEQQSHDQSHGLFQHYTIGDWKPLEQAAQTDLHWINIIPKKIKQKNPQDKSKYG
jgi:hypothetical protein